MVLQGFSPPVDASVAWTTVTPDPAVIEVNQAPQPDVKRFLASMRDLFEAAQSQGLSPYRLQYDGTVSDSGGGGQFTLGGRSAAIAALLRAIAAMLACAEPTPRLRDWGDALHDQYALPFFLRQDLCAVFDDLAAHDLRLGDRLCSELLHDPCKSRWHTVHAGCELAL